MDCQIFLSPFLDFIEMPMSTVSLLEWLESGILWTYGLSSFTSTVNKYLLSLGSFELAFL